MKKRLADWLENFWTKAVQKTILKRTADILEKLGIAGMALGIFQDRVDGTMWGCVFLILSYAFSIMEARK